mgnify:CR=1 FL=1
MTEIGFARFVYALRADSLTGPHTVQAEAPKLVKLFAAGAKDGVLTFPGLVRAVREYVDMTPGCLLSLAAGVGCRGWVYICWVYMCWVAHCACAWCSFETMQPPFLESRHLRPCHRLLPQLSTLPGDRRARRPRGGSLRAERSGDEHAHLER